MLCWDKIHILLFYSFLLLSACTATDTKEQQSPIASSTNSLLPKSDSVFTISPTLACYVYQLKGTIDGKYKISMFLKNINSELEGEYKYDNQKESLELEGKINGTEIYLENKFIKGSNVILGEYFKGKLGNNSIKGSWHSPLMKKTYPFQLETLYGAELNSPYVILTNAQLNGESLWAISYIRIYTDKGDFIQEFKLPLILKKNLYYWWDLNEDGFLDIRFKAMEEDIDFLFDPTSKTFKRNKLNK